MSEYLHSNYFEYLTQPNDATYVSFVPTVEALEHSLAKDRLYILWAANQKDHGEDPTVEKYLQHLNNVANYYGGDLNDADLPSMTHKYSPLYHALRAKERAELKQKVDKTMATLMLGGLGAYGFAAAPMLTTSIGAGLGAADYLDAGNVGTSLWNPGWKRTAAAYNDLKSGKVLDPTVFAGSVVRDVLDVAGMAGPAIAAYMRPEARLARELNRNIKQGIQSGLYYHGSPNRNISMFKTGKDGGIYFTQNRDAAKLYTGTFGTGKVYNADLDLGNKTITIDNGGAAWTKIPENTVAEAFNLTPQQVHDIIGSYNLGEFPWHYGFTKMFGYKPKNNYYAIDQVVKLGKDLGISSLIIKNAKDNGKRLFSRTMPYDLTVVYDPRQIILGGSSPNLNHYAPLPQMSKTSPTKTSLAFYERQPSKNKGERLGIPKGLERTIINNEEEILNNAKSFAEKYGYEIPETIDAAKAMYNLHNSFFRTPSNHESVILHYDPELAKLPLELLYFKLASKGYPESMRSYDFSKNGIYNDDFVFVAPDYGEVMPYINDVPAVMLRRPFRKSNPLTWHKDAEWTIQSKYTPYDQVFGKSKIGTAQIGNAGPLHEFKVSTRHLQPVKIAEPADKGTLLGIHLGPYEYKSGGSIKIKKKNKGKFTDYCGGKVTEECIRKGKNSSNPTTRKRANFAANARKWKHEEGGTLNYLNYFK